MSLLTDAGLTLKIKSALIADERIGARGINVDTKDGTVTLLGAVPGEEQRERAEEIALEGGARQVVNALALEDASHDPPAARIPPDFMRVVAPAGTPVTARPTLEEAVRAALVADRRVNAHLIYVQVKGGIAYLTGRQDTVQARDAAGEVAARVSRIDGVDNDLEVMSSV